MTALQAAEVWRDRFLEMAWSADSDLDARACMEAAAILEALREELKRLCNAASQ